MSFRKTTFPISLMNLFVVLGLRFTFNNSSNSLLNQGLNSSILIANQLNVTLVDTDIELLLISKTLFFPFLTTPLPWQS